jgi:hypothetical protein
MRKNKCKIYNFHCCADKIADVVHKQKISNKEFRKLPNNVYSVIVSHNIKCSENHIKNRNTFTNNFMLQKRATNKFEGVPHLEVISTSLEGVEAKRGCLRTPGGWVCDAFEGGPRTIMPLCVCVDPCKAQGYTSIYGKSKSGNTNLVIEWHCNFVLKLALLNSKGKKNTTCYM